MLSPVELLRVLLVAIGIYLVVCALPVLGMYAGMFLGVGAIGESEFQTISNWSGVAAQGLSLILGGLLVLLSEPLARWIEGDGPTARVSSPSGAQAAAIAVVGVFFAMRGLSGVAASLVLASSNSFLWVSSGLIPDLIQAGIGIGAFFGSRQLAELWHSVRFQTAAEPAAEQPDEPDAE